MLADSKASKPFPGVWNVAYSIENESEMFQQLSHFLNILLNLNLLPVLFSTTTHHNVIKKQKQIDVSTSLEMDFVPAFVHFTSVTNILWNPDVVLNF